MQFCTMVSTSRRQHPHYRNCCWFALAPAGLGLGPEPAGSGCGCKRASNGDRRHHFTRSCTSSSSSSSSRLSLLISQPAGPHHLHPLSLQSKDTAKLFVTGLCTLRKQASSSVLVAQAEIKQTLTLLFVTERQWSPGVRADQLI